MKHAFEADPLSLEGDCRICGLNIPHPELDDGPLAEYDRPPVCKSCRHYAHQGRCWASVPAYPEPKACPCKGAAA